VRRPPLVLALLIVAVLAAGIVGVAIHAPSHKTSGVAAPPTTQEVPTTT
jgi:hypothetical protein